MSKTDMFSLALALAEEEVSYEIIVRGLSRETYEKMPGEHESAGTCSSPDCDCFVWEKQVDFGEDGVLVFSTTDPVELRPA